MDVNILVPRFKVPKAHVLWIDPITNKWEFEEIPLSAYRELGWKTWPEKPEKFNGDEETWKQVWESGPQRAKAVEGFH